LNAARFLLIEVTPEICPNCGAAVPERARACPECGADEQTGWSDEAQAQRLGLPDDRFDYDEFVKEEFGGRAARPQVRPRGISWLWWLVALGLVLAMIWPLLQALR
jgi:hypothetical protein